MEDKAKMKAAVVVKYGSPEGILIKKVEKPSPKDDEVLVKIHATTVTFGDAMLRKLKFPIRLIFGLRKNEILGHELAGVIESVGKDVKRFNKGDKVFAGTGMRGGTHAEYICFSEAKQIAVMPKNVTFEEAAAVPVGGNTALDILKKGDIQNGQKVLIYGASGSVGTFAVQLSKHAYGAEVTGVCSAKNFDLVKSLGANKVIDYTQENFTKSGEKYDVIFDAVRKISHSQCKEVLKPDGIFLSVRSPTKAKLENLLFLKELIESRKIKPVIDRRYSLDEITEAHRYVDTGHKKGNVVINVV